jgi:hypothetical protein
MKRIVLSLALGCTFFGPTFAWGPEGHSIVAEVAQHRLSPQAMTMVERLLGRGRSLASIASWADDVRGERPETYKWHFVDIPLAVRKYDMNKYCKPSAPVIVRSRSWKD